MADVVINTKINNAEIEKTVNNFARLKSELKQAKSELLQFEVGTEGFAKAQDNVSKLTHKMKGLNDSTKIQGTGVERLTQSFNLLTDSFATGDIDKAKLAFTGLGQAMKAIPIFLLIEGARLLFENWDKLTAIFSESAQQLKANERALVELNLAVADNKVKTDALIITKEFELKQLERNKASLQDIINKTNEIDNLKLTNVVGELSKLDKEISNLQARQKDLKENLQLSDFLPDFLGGDATNKEIQSIGDKIKELQTKKKELSNEGLKIDTDNKDKIAQLEQVDNEKALERRRKLDEDNLKIKKDAQAREAEIANFYIDLEETQFKDALKRQNEAAEQARIENLDAKARAADAEEKYFRNIDEQNYKKNEATNKARRAKEEQDIKASENAKLQARKVGLDAAQGLSQAFFQSQLNGAKGNAAAELKIRKQMFEVDKAFNVARAIQDGIRAVQAALTIPPPGGQILAVANGALAAANVAKILSTQFDGGTQNVDVPNVSLPTGGGGQTPNTFQPPTFVQQSTQLDDNGNPINQPIQAVVAETQVTSVQNRVSRLYRQSRI